MNKLLLRFCVLIFVFVGFLFVTSCSTVKQAQSLPDISVDSDPLPKDEEDKFVVPAGPYAENLEEAAGSVFYLVPKVGNDCKNPNNIEIKYVRRLVTSKCSSLKSKVISRAIYDNMVDAKTQLDGNALFANISSQNEAKVELSIKDVEDIILSDDCVPWSQFADLPDKGNACFAIYAKGVVLTEVSGKTYKLVTDTAKISGPAMSVGGQIYSSTTGLFSYLKMRIYPTMDAFTMRSDALAKRKVPNKPTKEMTSYKFEPYQVLFLNKLAGKANRISVLDDSDDWNADLKVKADKKRTRDAKKPQQF